MKFRQYIFLLFLLSPLSLIGVFFLFTFTHTSFEYVQNRNAEISTFYSGTVPNLEKYMSIKSWNSDTSWGEIAVLLNTDKRITVMNEQGIKLFTVFSRDPNLNEYVNYESTGSGNDWDYIPTEKPTGSRVGNYANIGFVFYDANGNEMNGPVVNGKLQGLFGYKDGYWEHYTFSELAKLFPSNSLKESKREFYNQPEKYDYTVMITQSYGFLFRNYQVLQKPEFVKFYYTRYRPWDLIFIIDGQHYTSTFSTVEKPRDLEFYPTVY